MHIHIRDLFRSKKGWTHMNLDGELKKLRVWERIVQLERAVFNTENPAYNTESNFKRLSQKMERDIYSLSQYMERLDGRISSVESLEEKFKASQKEIEIKNAEIVSLRKERDELEKEKNEQITHLSTQKAELEHEKRELQEEIRLAKAEIERVNEAKANLESEKNEKISRLSTQKVDLEHEKEELQEEMMSKRAEIKKLNEEIAQLREEKSDLEKQCEEQQYEKEKQRREWSEFTSVYRDLMKMMYRCQNLAEMVEDFGMDISKGAEDFQSVIGFVGMLGNEYTFPPLVYRYWGDFVLDENDIAFIDVVNQYYKEYLQLDYDILWYPTDEEKKFDKEKMKDKESPTSPFRHYSEVYAPAVMRDADKILFPATVKGER